MSRRHPGKTPTVESRAELALSELCSQLGYCLPPNEQEGILANPPKDAEAFVDAVLTAEGRDPNVVVKQDRRPMLDIVSRLAIYGGGPGTGSVASRLRFPSDR